MARPAHSSRKSSPKGVKPVPVLRAPGLALAVFRALPRTMKAALTRFLPLLKSRFSRILKGMEVHFTPEQETQLSKIATHAGTDIEQLVKDAALRLLQEEARFRAAVREATRCAALQISKQRFGRPTVFK